MKNPVLPRKTVALIRVSTDDQAKDHGPLAVFAQHLQRYPRKWNDVCTAMCRMNANTQSLSATLENG